MRPGWHTYFLGIANAVAERSDCRRAMVGAVIIDTRRRIISTGYVGTSPGRRGCLDGGCPRGLLARGQDPGPDYSNCISFHAEANALLYSDRTRHEHGSIYVTRKPCDWCAKLIGASGLRTLVYLGDVDVEVCTVG